MIPKQIIPGSHNGIAGTFASGEFGGFIYLAYASSNAVVILATGSLRVLQVLGGHEQDVKCLEWSQTGGRLASGSENKVVIYSPVVNEQPGFQGMASWVPVCTIQQEYEVTAVSWLPLEDYLVVGGSSLAIWKLNWGALPKLEAKKAVVEGVLSKQARQRYEDERQREEKKRQQQFSRILWKTSCSSQIHHIACSSDGKFFATSGKYDRVIKVWYKRAVRQPTSATPSAAATPRTSADGNETDEDEDAEKENKRESVSFGFIYLPHPRSVISFSWRPMTDKPNPKRGWFFQNVLLTQSRDNVTRLWLQSPNALREQFHVCSVIASGADSVVSWLTELPGPGGYVNPAADLPVEKETREVEEDNKFLVHTANNCTHNGIARHSALALSTKLHSTIDWIMGIQRDGTVVIWKLKDVDSHTKQTPSLSIWNSAQILPLQEVSPHRMVANYARERVNRDRMHTPSDISLYIYTNRGAISCWNFSIHGAAKQIMSSTLSSRCYGHKNPIVELAASPTLPLISSIDSCNNLIFWQIRDTTVVDPPFVLMDISSLTGITTIAYAPVGNICIASNGEGLFAYEMEVSPSSQLSMLPPRLPLTVLEGSAEFGRMLFLGVRTGDRPLKIPEGQGANLEYYYVVSISEDGHKLYVWTLEVNPSATDIGKVTSKLVIEHIFPPEITITCASLSPSSPYTNEDFSISPCVVTGDAEGKVVVWCIARKTGDKHVLREMVGFSAYSEAVAQVKCVQFGRVATVSSSGQPEIHIWEMESTAPVFKLEKTMQLYDKAKDGEAPVVVNQTSGSSSTPSTPPVYKLCFDWLPLANGNYVLTIGYGTKVRVFGPKRSKQLQSFEVEWEVTDEFLNLAQPCQSLIWARDGSLLVAAASNLYVFSKWRDVLQVNTGDPNQSEENLDWITFFHRNSANKSLPPFHPKILMEYLLAGHFERVGVILYHLLDYLKEHEAKQTKSKTVFVPAILLDELLSIPKGGFSSAITDKQEKKVGSEDDDLSIRAESYKDDILDAEKDQQGSGPRKFGPQQAAELAELLTSVILPSVSGTEQMYLLAIIDTFKQMQETQGALDDRGTRFALSVKMFSFMRRSGSKYQQTALHAADFIWALHSDSQETILKTVVPPDADWPILRSLGAGFWITNPTVLRSIVERLAKLNFLVKKDPADSALYYVALKKRGALAALYKTVKEQKLVDFLSGDFTQPKQITAAVKNAYALQGKHRYELAAAFFLLADRLKDAVTVIIQYLADIQLALLISRVYEGENGPVFAFILETHVIPQAQKTKDVALISVSYWLLKRYQDALTTLNETFHESTMDKHQINPNILYFFHYLRGHTLLRNAPEKHKQDDMLLRKSTYAYSSSNCGLLAIEQLDHLRQGHAVIEPTGDSDNEDEGKEKKDESKTESTEAKTSESKQEEEEDEGGNDFPYNYGGTSMYGGYGGGSYFGGSSNNEGEDDFGSGGNTGGGSGGGGSGGDWFDDFLGSSSSTPVASSTAQDSSIPTTSDGTKKAGEEDKPKGPSRYEHAVSPLVDLSLTFHVAIQILTEEVEELRRSRQWRQDLKRVRKCVQILAEKAGVEEESLVKELLKYCAERQYIEQLYDLATEYQNMHTHTPNSLLVNTSQEILSLAGYITSYPISVTQASHLSALATEIYECTEIAQDLNNSDRIVINCAIYMGHFFSAWAQNQPAVLHAILRAQNVKELAAGVKTARDAHNADDVDGGAYSDVSDDERSKADSTPLQTASFLAQVLLVLVLRKFTTNIEEYMFHSLQATRSATCTKLVEHLVRWIRYLQCKIGKIPQPLLQAYRNQQQQPTTYLATFYEFVKSKAVTVETKKLWEYLAQQDTLADFINELFTEDEKSHIDIPLEYSVTFENETVLYKDSDILQSFCINAVDNNYVAVATTKGIREIDLRQLQAYLNESSDEENSDEDQHAAGSKKTPRTDPSALAKISSKSVSSLPSFKSKQTLLKMAFSQFNTSKELDHNIIVQWVESHPHYPYYLSGGIDGSVCLWQFGVPEALAAYRLPPHPWVMRCRFNPTGTKFGACDMAGNLSLWKFNAPEDALRPFHTMQAHTKNTLDFAFLNNGSFIATVGISTETKRIVCLWDVLQPPHKAMVSSFTDPEAGASSVVYSPRHQMLIAGGKKGGIYVFDVRRNRLVESFKPHTLNTKTLAMDMMEQFVVSGSSDGNIKIWDMPTMTNPETWEDVHKRQTFVRPTGVFKSPVSTYGVMAVGVVGDHIYSCGADRRLIKRKFAYGQSK